MIVHKGKPTHAASGCAWGVILAPALLFGGGWLLGLVVEGLKWLGL